MLCRQCNAREVPPRQGETGRPRTKCLVCQPPPDPKRRAANRAAQDRLNARRRRETARARRAAEANYDTMLCGCDRDYLTVPLDEAHVCPTPRPLPVELARTGQGYYDPERYPWR